jgi:ABC-type enterochelin transport system substrate-binding protein
MKIGISMTLSFLVMLLVGCQQKENETTQQSVKTSSGATLLILSNLKKVSIPMPPA